MRNLSDDRDGESRPVGYSEGQIHGECVMKRIDCYPFQATRDLHEVSLVATD